MDGNSPEYDPAFPLLALDIVNNVLAHAANPGELGEYLTCELRELTGAKTAVILQCRYRISDGYTVVSVNPTRRTDIIESSQIQHLADICRQQNEIVKWDNQSQATDAQLILNQMGYGLSVGIPLCVGDAQVGVILLLGLPEKHNLRLVIDALRTISTIVALVLRNSFLYREQENIIAERTGLLQESEARYRLLIESQNDLVVKFDTEGNILFASPSYCRAFGKSDADLIGTDFAPQIHAQDRLKEAENQKKLYEEPYTVEYEERIFTVDGWRWFSWASKAIRDNTGCVEAIISVGRDITPRKEVESERMKLMKDLSLKNKELQSIVYIASHDLKSPLVNIQGFSAQLDEACNSLKQYTASEENIAANIDSIQRLIDEDIQESMTFIQAGTEKMWTLVNGFLHISRLGSAELDIKTLDMNRLIAKVLRAMQYQIDQSNTKVTVEELPQCLGDPRQLNQVFSNLIDNAMKYRDPVRKCCITVSGRIENGFAAYSVSDNGIGIAEHHQHKVFEMFHRLNPDNSVSGEGLGLAIVSRILARQDGRIHLTSQPNRGCTFTVTLPVPDTAALAVSQPKQLTCP